MVEPLFKPGDVVILQSEALKSQPLPMTVAAIVSIDWDTKQPVYHVDYVDLHGESRSRQVIQSALSPEVVTKEMVAKWAAFVASVG